MNSKTLIRLALLAIVLLCVAGYAGMARLRVRRVYARMAADGIPLTWAELERIVRADDTNPAAWLAFHDAMEAIAALPELPTNDWPRVPIEGTAPLPDLWEPMPPEMLASIEARLQTVSPAMSALREALSNGPMWRFAVGNAFAEGSVGEMAPAHRVCMMLHDFDPPDCIATNMSIPREPFGDGPYGWEQNDGIGVLSFAFPDKHMPPYTFTVLGPRGGGEE